MFKGSKGKHGDFHGWYPMELLACYCNPATLQPIGRKKCQFGPAQGEKYISHAWDAAVCLLQMYKKTHILVISYMIITLWHIISKVLVFTPLNSLGLS